MTPRDGFFRPLFMRQAALALFPVPEWKAAAATITTNENRRQPLGAETTEKWMKTAEFDLFFSCFGRLLSGKGDFYV